MPCCISAGKLISGTDFPCVSTPVKLSNSFSYNASGALNGVYADGIPAKKSSVYPSRISLYSLYAASLFTPSPKLICKLVFLALIFVLELYKPYAFD